MNLKALELLKIICDREKISYTDIARKINKSPQSVSQLFKSDNISLKNLETLAAAVGYTVKIDFEKIEK